MKRCTNKDIQRLLYGYELGILSDEERERVEVHLFECEICFNQVEQFKPAVRLIKRDADVREVMRNSDRPDRRPFWSRPIVRTSLAAAAVFVFLLVQPWRIRIETTDEVLAFPNLIAIMYFQNLTGSDPNRQWGAIVTDLLITDFSESGHLSVMSHQRLYDELKLMGREGERVIDRGTGTNIAKRAHARWILEGSVVQAKPTFIVNARVVDAESGVVLASERVVGVEGENIFSVVDRLSTEVKSSLELPAAAYQEQDRAVAEMSTSSVEAYEHYLQGVEYSYKYMDAQARASLQRAIEIDSTFALAYYALSTVLYSNAGAETALENAVRYIDRVNEKQRHYILARQARLNHQLALAAAHYDSLLQKYPEEKGALSGQAIISAAKRDYQAALDLYDRVLELDSTYYSAWISVATLADRIGDFALGLRAAMKLISLAPDDPIPYNVLGDQYAHNGMLEEAIKAYRKSLDRDSLNTASMADICEKYLVMGDYERTDSIVHHYLNYPYAPTRGYGRHRATLIARRKGQFRKAIRQLDEGIEADRKEFGFLRSTGHKIYDKASIQCWFLDECDSAIATTLRGIEMARGFNPGSPNIGVVGDLAGFYAKKGDWRGADSILAAMDSFFDSSDYANNENIYFWRGQVEYLRGNYDSAVALFEKTCAAYPASTGFQDLGKAYVAAGRLEDGIKMYEKALMRFDREKAINVEWGVLLHYDAGVAYEAAGMTNKAIQQYETFLNIWAEADSDLTSVEDARVRLVRLKNNP
jgi:tetratricopeptide (TPR) repeat protein